MTDTLCTICGRHCKNEIFLTDGRVCHHDCTTQLQSSRLELQFDINDLRYKQFRLLKKLRSSRAWYGKLAIVFRFNRTDESSLLKQEEDLASGIGELTRSIELLDNRLTDLYDYWPDYPPDWPLRRDLALSPGRVCSNCNRYYRNPHVHHRTPISRGGSHRPENLMVLCEECHEKAHGVDSFRNRNVDVRYHPGRHLSDLGTLLPSNDPRTDTGGSRIRYTSPLMRKIRETIDSSQILHFHYKRWDGAESERSIYPTEILKVENTWCVRGFCFLRTEERTFALKRMRNVKRLIEPGPCRDC